MKVPKKDSSEQRVTRETWTHAVTPVLLSGHKQDDHSFPQWHTHTLTQTNFTVQLFTQMEAGRGEFDLKQHKISSKMHRQISNSYRVWNNIRKQKDKAVHFILIWITLSSWPGYFCPRHHHHHRMTVCGLSYARIRMLIKLSLHSWLY